MKKLGIGVIVLGAFLLTLGVLSKAYMYDRVAVVPSNAEIDSVASTAPGAPGTIFDIGQLKEVQVALENRVQIRGDVEASKQASKELGGKYVVWDAYSCTDKAGENCLSNPLPLAGARDIMAISSHGSVADPKWSGSLHESGGETDESPATRGSVFKLPFNVQKNGNYSYWVGSLDKSVKLTYEGETKVKGLRVFKYSQVVPATKVGTIDLPGSLVGSDEATVTGDRMVSNRMEMTVEPETGVAMTTTSSPDNFVEVNGERVLTTTKATLSIDDATVADNVANYRTLSTLLHAVRVQIPVGGIVIGLLLVILGGVLVARSKKKVRNQQTTRANRRAEDLVDA